jgi:CRISPR system Cascade subunit CasC
MTEPRFLQIHTLQSYPAVLLNRDDAGLAKRLPFGGATRTRISSQCLKRHWRMANDGFSLANIEGVEFAKRSRLIFSRALVTDLVREHGYEEKKVREVVMCLKDRMFPKKNKDGETAASKAGKEDPLETEQAFLLGNLEIEYLRSIVRRVMDGDKEFEGALAEKPKKADQKTAFQKLLRDNLEALSATACTETVIG